MQTIHNAQAGEVSIRLVQRSIDFMIVLDDGGKFAAIDPRGRCRDHAIRCFDRACELAEAEHSLIVDIAALEAIQCSRS